MFFNVILLLPYIILVRIDTFISPQVYNYDSTESHLILDSIYSVFSTPLAQSILSVFLIFIHLLLINRIINGQKISKENTLFAGVFYVLFISIFDTQPGISPLLIGATFMLLAIDNSLRIARLQTPTAYIFNAGFMIGVAALIYEPYIILTLWGVVLLMKFRSFKLSELLQFLIGISVPYFLIFTYRFWYGQPYVELNFFDNLTINGALFSFAHDFYSLLILSIFLLAILFSFSIYVNIMARKSVQVNNKIGAFYWYLAFCSLMLFSFTDIDIYDIMVFSIPLAFITGIAASESSRKLFYEMVHLVLLASVFIIRFKLINL